MRTEIRVVLPYWVLKSCALRVWDRVGDQWRENGTYRTCEGLEETAASSAERTMSAKVVTSVGRYPILRILVTKRSSRCLSAAWTNPTRRGQRKAVARALLTSRQHGGLLWSHCRTLAGF